MEDEMKTLGVWIGVGAALGAGVALGMGLRVLMTGAAVGVGAGLALGLANRTRRHSQSPRMVPAFTQPALH
jgi:hypothetical protein